MKHIALLADIHGNIPALSAVHEDLRTRDIDQIWCLGDMAGGGPNGRDVIDWCRENCTLILQGNWEDFLIQESWHPRTKKYIREMGPEHYEFIKTLPLSHKVWISGRRLHLFHGRPLFEEIVYVDAPDKKKLELFSVLEDDYPPDIVGYADIHRQYKTDFHGDPRFLFNTGSVGNSFCTPTACYAILHGELDSRDAAPLSLEFVSVPYNIDLAVARALRESAWFDAEPYIKSIRTGTWQKID